MIFPVFIYRTIQKYKREFELRDEVREWTNDWALTILRGRGSHLSLDDPQAHAIPTVEQYLNMYTLLLRAEIQDLRRWFYNEIQPQLDIISSRQFNHLLHHHRVTKSPLAAMSPLPHLPQIFIHNRAVNVWVRFRDDSDDPVHPYNKCDFCHLGPIIGKRFMCSECSVNGDDSYDLCHYCYRMGRESLLHLKCHKMNEVVMTE